MNVISWNCRGLGHSSAVPNLKHFIQSYQSGVIFLYETIMNANKIEELQYILGFDCYFSFDREARVGGVAVLWHNSMHCFIQSYCHDYIYIIVQDIKHENWRLTDFYDHPEETRRRISWNLI